MNDRQQVAEILVDLERELRRLGLWESQRPEPEKLASRMPFAVDTLTFPQWLQFIFLERMELLLSTGQTLPGKSQISPMAEEYFKEAGLDGAGLVILLDRFDRLMNHQVNAG